MSDTKITPADLEAILKLVESAEHLGDFHLKYGDLELRVSRQWGLVRNFAARGDLGKIRYQHFSLFRHKFRQGSGGWRYDAAKVGSDGTRYGPALKLAESILSRSRTKKIWRACPMARRRNHGTTTRASSSTSSPSQMFTIRAK